MWKKILYTVIIIAAAWAVYWVVQNIGRFYKAQEEAASDIGEAEASTGGDKYSMWGSVAGTFIDPSGTVSGSGIL